MPFDLNPSDSRPIYVQIMDEIRRGIVLGTWRADEPLPSVRQLAVDLRVNPNTVQQAYRELERDSVIYVRRGQGCYVTPRENGADRSALLDDLAGRLLREAYRHGFDVAELTAALQREASRVTDQREASRVTDQREASRATEQREASRATDQREASRVTERKP